MRGVTQFRDDMVLVPPGAPLPNRQPDPVITAYRQQVRTILTDADFTASERLQIGDVTVEEAERLAAERIAERREQQRRDRVLRMLTGAGFPIASIESGRLP